MHRYHDTDNGYCKYERTQVKASEPQLYLWYEVQDNNIRVSKRIVPLTGLLPDASEFIKGT